MTNDKHLKLTIELGFWYNEKTKTIYLRSSTVNQGCYNEKEEWPEELEIDAEYLLLSWLAKQHQGEKHQSVVNPPITE